MCFVDAYVLVRIWQLHRMQAELEAAVEEEEARERDEVGLCTLNQVDP
jgi:hypothetical protein